jgi:Glutaredoxin-like domain (DUF836)
MRSASPEWRRQPISAGSTHSVLLYYAPECHLCAAARRVIGQVRDETPFELTEVDISGDPALEDSYRERIPVVVVDGEPAFTFYVHPDGLRRRLGAL